MGGDAVIYEDGKYVSNIDDLAYATAYNLLTRTISDYTLCMPERWRGVKSAERVFRSEERIVFQPYSNLEKELDFEYGVVPYPTMNGTGCKSVLYRSGAAFIQASNPSLEKSCFLIGKIAEIFFDTEAGTAYYENYLCDTDSMEMIREYVLPGLCSDPVLFSSGLWGGVYGALNNNVGLNAVQAVKEYSDIFAAAVEETFAPFNK